ncbi:MAG: helix-turn-helix transcriptional regulator [Chloroflexota bacterium]
MRTRALQGERLRQLRESHGLTQQQLAERLLMNINQIHRYENGTADPSAFQLKRIAKELQVTSDYLLGLVDATDEHLQESTLTKQERQFLEALRQGKVRTLLRLIDETVPDEQQQSDVSGVHITPDR